MHLLLHRVRRASVSCSLGMLGLVAGTASAQSIVGLGAIDKVERGNPTSVSDDGSIIGGEVWDLSGRGHQRACLWRRQPDGSYARDVIGTFFAARRQFASISFDGASMTVGFGGDPWFPPLQAVYYRCNDLRTPVRTWEQLMPFTDGTRFELQNGSADGMTFLGAAIEGDERRGFVWSARPGSPAPRPLDPLPGFERCTVNAVSRDWRVMLGASFSAANSDPSETSTRWVEGVPEPLESVPGWTDAYGYGVSADGTAIVGYASDGQRTTVGVLWRDGRSPIVIRGPRNAVITVPYALSQDGSTVVGWSRNDRYIAYIDRPWLWTQRTGTLDLNALVEQLGGAFAEWRIAHASHMSPNGRTLLGGGFRDGLYESFVMTLPTLCPADFDNDGDASNGGMPNFAVGIEDLVYFLAQFEAGDARLDLDDGSGTGQGDDAVDVADLLYFLARFEEGC